MTTMGCRIVMVVALLLTSTYGQSTLPELPSGCYYTTEVFTVNPGSFTFSSMSRLSTTVTATVTSSTTVTLESHSSTTSATSLSSNGVTEPTLESPGISSTLSSLNPNSSSSLVDVSTDSIGPSSISSASSGSSTVPSSIVQASSSTAPSASTSGPPVTTATDLGAVSSSTSSLASTSTSAGPLPDIRAGDFFTIAVNVGTNKAKRAIFYIAFRPNGITYLVVSKDDAALFVLDEAGNLLSGGQYVGTSTSSGTAALQLFSDPPVSPFFWNVDNGVVTFGFASFCITVTEQTFVVYDGQPALGCSEVQFEGDLVPVETTTTTMQMTSTSRSSTSTSSTVRSSSTISSSSLTSSSTITSRTNPPSASVVIPTFGDGSSSTLSISSMPSSFQSGFSGSLSTSISTNDGTNSTRTRTFTGTRTRTSFSSMSTSDSTSGSASTSFLSSGQTTTLSASASASSTASNSRSGAQSSSPSSQTVSTSTTASATSSFSLSAPSSSVTTFSTSSRISMPTNSTTFTRIQCSTRPSIRPSAYPDVPKRGLAYGNVTSLQFYTPPSQVSWAYDYYSLPNDSTNAGNRGPFPPPQNPSMTFFPLLFNDNPTLTSIWEANVNFAITNYGTDAIMSFNEPDLCIGGSACMTVARAIRAYARYIQPFADCGIRLAAPAITNTANGTIWLQQFLGNATALNLTVDIINLHWYASPYNQQYFQDYMTEKYNLFGQRPIWITEYGMDQPYQEAAILQFLRNTTYWVGQQPWVEKTCWFGNYNNNLLTSDGSALSARGQVWNSYKGTNYVYGFSKRDGTADGEGDLDGGGGEVDRPEGPATVENTAAFKNLQMEASVGKEWMQVIWGENPMEDEDGEDGKDSADGAERDEGTDEEDGVEGEDEG